MSIQVPFGNQFADQRFTGHGTEWRDANLKPEEAQAATQWVEAKIDKRSMLTNRERVEDVRDIMWQLEKDGEIVVHRVNDGHQATMTKTLYGWDKKIPTIDSGTTNPAVNAGIYLAIQRLCSGL